MAEHAHKLEIFRGLIKFKSNTQKIIGVLLLLTSVFLILYLTFILIQEGGYIFDEFDDTSNYIKTDF